MSNPHPRQTAKIRNCCRAFLSMLADNDHIDHKLPTIPGWQLACPTCGLDMVLDGYGTWHSVYGLAKAKAAKLRRPHTENLHMRYPTAQPMTEQTETADVLTANARICCRAFLNNKADTNTLPTKTYTELSCPDCGNNMILAPNGTWRGIYKFTEANTPLSEYIYAALFVLAIASLIAGLAFSSFIRDWMLLLLAENLIIYALIGAISAIGLILYAAIWALKRVFRR